MDEKLSKAFARLKVEHGSHSAAARALGIHHDHYGAMRNGRANIPQRTANYIIAMAGQCRAEATTPAEEPADVHA